MPKNKWCYWQEFDNEGRFCTAHIHEGRTFGCTFVKEDIREVSPGSFKPARHKTKYEGVCQDYRKYPKDKEAPKIEKWRGHDVYFKDNKCFYADTKAPTVGNPRPCGHCGKSDTKDGHDACLGALPGVMNACCGHGEDKEAYIQFENGMRLSGFRIEAKITTEEAESE